MNTVHARQLAPVRRHANALFCVVALCTMASPAGAHSGHAQLDAFALAALHPWTGLDHMLAAWTAGLLAAHRGARGGAAVLAAYLVGLVTGVLLGGGASGLALETAIGASVVVMAWLLAQPRIGPGLVAVTALFAACHGAAHHVEGDVAGALLLTVGAFALSTAVLLALGVGVGRLVLRDSSHRRLVAWPIATAGALLLATTWAA
jgi:urease accessory protein